MSAERKAAAGLANSNERIRSYYYNDSRVTDHRIGLTMQVSGDVGSGEQ
jgi:protein subunit release factor A